MSDSVLVCEIINSSHQSVIESFDCGKVLVNNFLKEEALKLNDVNLVKTRLYFDEDHNFIGFFSLFNESVSVMKSKRTQQQWIDIEDQKNIFPAIRLHFLGVNQKYQKIGLGEYLLFEAIYAAKDISEISGCTFVTLETEDDCYQFYENRDFVYLRKNERNNKFSNMCLKIS
ncbi:N-acetyltransferase [Paenibacillus sp. FSL M7-0420]|uniref:N-acetyltransferase n=1 Tax=Paenibacillus sp. FSL M7-0420 TaxID=2921609 RepID=UPI0030FADD67